VAIVGLEIAFRNERPPTRAHLGLIVQDMTVRSVLSDGPAYLAGVCAGDELVALNGRKFNSDFVTQVEQRMKPGEHVELQVMRRNQLRTFTFELGSKPNGRWQLSRVSKPSPQQKSAYESWLRQQWPI
jgi:predicted metalloprotease with PDZ domain